MSKKQRGAVSIFVVIFASLLITVVTVSFMRLMLQTAQEASTVDLSQSAYDAALDGVEDAKRAIVTDRNKLGGTNCDQVARALNPVHPPGEEKVIEQSPEDVSLSMAYTCVTIDFDADDYVEDRIDENTSTLVPLHTAGGAEFEQIRIKWRRASGPHGTNAELRDISEVTGANILPAQSDWNTADPEDPPALLRVRYIWAGPTFDLNAHYNSINSNEFEEADRSRTMFFFPVDDGTSDNNSVAISNATRPTLTNCTGGDYDCTMTLTSVLGGASAAKYVQITPLYTSADINIELLDGSGNIVPFSDVQAVVDSTGRASDVFRRVQARVRLDGVGSINYPSDALTLNGGNLCKDFYVTDTLKPHSEISNCQP